ncbi:MAG TPA: TPM domain-containing protein [Methylibium sp.]|uniref:TPM domain-containing protein n=1 Tax=Methylibium sp. TaxID=2067992 RepID=UPI002DBEA35F|nr:TPM domain-containing protein [Methylibium sp.]HEU4458237.1 TPM domain-containing protein [Methylibium sp.]
MRVLARSVAALLLAFAASLAFAQDLRPVPVLTASVIDQTGTLSRAQTSALEAKLAGHERELGAQIVVLIVATTQPEDVASYAQRVGEAWKIGRREVGDGLLIVVAKGDRRLHIATAKSLEGAIPDLAAKQIIDATLQPAFRAGDYAGGLNAAVDRLAARIKGEALPPPSAPGRVGGSASAGTDLGDLALFFLLGVPVAATVLTAMLGRKLGSLATGGGAGALAWVLTASFGIAIVAGLIAVVLVGVLGFGAASRGLGGRRGAGAGMPPIVWGGGGSWGGGGGGGFGGGFSSGGGGDFGGGGASGDW